MRTTTIAAAITAGTILTLATPAAAHATTSHTAKCADAGVTDHINKTDNGHGTPAEWADLRLKRYVGIQCTSPGHYKVLISDDGTLRTRVGAGTPNGTGGQITHRVPGTVHGVYGLAVDGELAIPAHRDTSLSSTEYVKSLFADGATVTGGEYAWTYVTRCGEKWRDWSKNNDGQGAAAGNITGKTCRPSHSPTPTPTPTSPSGTPTSSPTTVPVGAPQTGDGTGHGGGPGALLVLGGFAMVGAGALAGVVMLRRRGQHH
jgi:hypothetical protein